MVVLLRNCDWHITYWALEHSILLKDDKLFNNVYAIQNALFYNKTCFKTVTISHTMIKI